MAVRTNILLKLSNFVDSLITFAKLQNIATDKILGRTTAGSGVIEELDIANYSNKLIPLTTTFANAENTTTAINIVTVTIPANSLAVGDIIKIDYLIRRLQNRGSTANLTQRLFNNTGSMIGNITGVISNNSSTYHLRQSFEFIVTNISAGVVTIDSPLPQDITLIMVASTMGAIGTGTVGNGASLGNLINNTFLNAIGTTIKLQAQWASANANTWIRVQQAQAYIIKKAV